MPPERVSNVQEPVVLMHQVRAQLANVWCVDSAFACMLVGVVQEPVVLMHQVRAAAQLVWFVYVHVARVCLPRMACCSVIWRCKECGGGLKAFFEKDAAWQGRIEACAGVCVLLAANCAKAKHVYFQSVCVLSICLRLFRA